MSDTVAKKYDVIIIGAGQSGGPLATAFAGSGKKTALIEREHAGGTCINEGCTPTKTMVASGRIAYLAKRSADYGIKTGRVTVDMAAVRQRKRDIVASFRGGSERRLTGVENLDYIRGEARFTGEKSLEVDVNSGGTLHIEAPLIFINAGARPSVPPLDGLETVPYLTSTSIMELADVPPELLIVGGGYIALEFGQLFQRLGSQVTIVQRGPRLLRREDPDVAEAVAGILSEDGLRLILNSTTKGVEAHDGKIFLTVGGPDGEATLEGTHLLLATGRTPNTDTLNLEAAGVRTDEQGYIPVDARLETNVPGIYALGDINGGPAFTHISYDDFRIIRTNFIEDGRACTDGRMVPYTMYIDPQLGRVGLSETEARDKGLNIKVASMPMNYVARALEVDEARGLMKAVVDAETEQILGCAILGLEGGEIMSMIEIAMMGKVPYSTLKNAIFAHPTLAESLNNLFGSFKD